MRSDDDVIWFFICRRLECISHDQKKCGTPVTVVFVLCNEKIPQCGMC